MTGLQRTTSSDNAKTPLVRAWSHGEESAQARAAAYALDMSSGVSFAALFLHRLAEEPSAVAELTRVLARISDVVSSLEEAEESRVSSSLTVRQLIPGQFWQSALGGVEPKALAHSLRAALSDETRPEAEQLRRLARELAELGDCLEQSAHRLAPRD